MITSMLAVLCFQSLTLKEADIEMLKFKILGQMYDCSQQASL